MSQNDSETEKLLQLAENGDRSALNGLLSRFRERLKMMAMVRMDSRLAQRIDPSDVVQETMVAASKRLSEYLRKPEVPFYLWLRRIAEHKLGNLFDQHIASHKRSVLREQNICLSDHSVHDLAQRLFDHRSSPSKNLRQAEVQARVRQALEKLASSDREILVLRHLEQLSIREIAIMLNLSESAVKMRQFRAAVRLRELLDDVLSETRR